MDNLTFTPNTGYNVSYPKNSLLKDLPQNGDSVKRMMVQLESKLIKNGLLAQFNDCLKDFINAGVVAPVSDGGDAEKLHPPVLFPGQQ